MKGEPVLTHLLLVALKNRADDIALPHWEPLISADDESMAMKYWLRSQRTCQHRYSLWVTVDSQGFIGIRAYVCWSQNADTFAHLTLPVEILEALPVIKRMLVQHGAITEDTRFATVK